MKKDGGSPLGLYTIGIAALFLAGFFLLVVFGAQSYRAAAASQEANMDTRALLAYFDTAVKADDSEGSVRIEDGLAGADGQTLLIADGDTGYDVRVYLHEGRLLEEFAESGSDLMPDDANVIGETSRFEAQWLRDGGLLQVDTDAGRVYVTTRSGGEAE